MARLRLWCPRRYLKTFKAPELLLNSCIYKIKPIPTLKESFGKTTRGYPDKYTRGRPKVSNSTTYDNLNAEMHMRNLKIDPLSVIEKLPDLNEDGTNSMHSATSGCQSTQNLMPDVVQKFGQPQSSIKKLDSIQIENVSTKISNSEKKNLNLETTKPPKVTKIRSQYDAIAAQYPGHMILMQVGDFYEIFGSDAEQASRILDLGLCTGDKYRDGMTGIPLRSLEYHLERLVRAGVSIVVCDQVGPGENAKVRRPIRIVTPGTLTEESLLRGNANNFLMALSRKDSVYTCAWMDVSTGQFMIQTVDSLMIIDLLSQVRPSEILLDPLDITDIDETLRRLSITTRNISFKTYDGTLPETLNNGVSGDKFNSYDLNKDEFIIESKKSDKISSAVHEIFTKITSDLELDAGERFVTEAILEYVIRTQMNNKPYISPIARKSNTMRLDSAAIESLELARNNSTGEREDSLLGCLDANCTAAGSRTLAQILLNPLVDHAEIEKRLDLVTIFYNDEILCKQLREMLKRCKDVERSFQRVALNRSTGGPRDLNAVRIFLQVAAEIQKLLLNFGTLEYLYKKIHPLVEIVSELESALVENPPQRVEEGTTIRTGYSAELDKLRRSHESLENERDQLILRYKEKTGVRNLRLTDRKTIGWLIEVPARHSTSLDETFLAVSGVEGLARYRTLELDSLYDLHQSGGKLSYEKEVEMYNKLRNMVIDKGDLVMESARTISHLDVFSTIGLLSRQRNYTRPKIFADSLIFDVKNGRHPVVDAKHSSDMRQFTPNNCVFPATQPFILITGPNMGGKSTFLRQNALFTIMAQCGFYVPADSAEIGLADAVFTRIGARDDLARDQSTFMVEMGETATILRMATQRSIVIMDEVGRGTSASEGLVLARGIVRYLLQRLSCRTLFATHYSELGKLVSESNGKCLMTTLHVEEDGTISFLHTLLPGIAQKSHAMEIARLAGVPEEVLLLSS